MDRTFHGRPSQRRQVLGDATLRANEDTSSTQRPNEKSTRENIAASSPTSLPHNESLVPNGSLAVRHPQPSSTSRYKRISAVIQDECRPRNPKRDSEISNASTNASIPGNGRRRKTHIGPWQLGKTVGRGGCSRVRMVRHTVTGEYGAAKIISKDTAEKVRAMSLANLIESAAHDPTLAGAKVIPFGLEREICIMKLLNHPNIVRLHDIWENRNELYLIMEYVQGGELFQYIGDHGLIQEIEVVYLFRQIIAALMYCHRLNIHHRDLKPENILIDKDTLQIKLVDFGMAALQPNGTKLTTPCGSPHYAAPEVIRPESYDGGKADVWSCGVILYVMLTGTPPFNYSGDEEPGLRQLFRLIARAEYIMPDMLSHESQDLIRRILVPEPKKRLSIEQVWEHKFLHKYDAELGFEGERGSIQSWVGPLPSISDWKPLTRNTVDREILRYLRTLWHSEKEELLVKRLISKEANQEKYFYSALIKYRDDQLEDYSPGAHTVAYSNSDHHHHVKRTPTSQDMLHLPSNMHNRSRSGYSILNDEHLYSQHSFYEPPSEGSYDPFRASRDPIIPTTSINHNVTVRRGSGSDTGSRRIRPVTAMGHRTGSSLRMMALRNSKRQSSSLSRKSSSQSGASSCTRPSVAARRQSVSRSSMVSSHWPSSPPVIARPGSLGKRGVSFSHLRKSSIASRNTDDTTGLQCTPEQRKRLNRAPSSAATSRLSSPGSISQRTPPARLITKPAVSPRVWLRKPESPSKYIQTEARKVSTELEKVMEEAFNRSSMGSSINTAVTDANKCASEYDTPPTSFTNTRDSGASTLVTPQQKAMLHNRPLPPIPNETPNTFLLRKLAETREELVQRLDQEGDSSEHYNKVLDHLDRLMQPPTNSAKRTSSAPTKSPEHPALLPVIAEEVKGDGQDRYEPYSQPYRAVTEPLRPILQARRAATETQANTIRLVDNSPTPIAPLNIRKRSGMSTSSPGANDSHSVPWPGPAPQPPVRSYQGVQNDLLAARTNVGRTSSAATTASDGNEASLKKKKSSWFRRNMEEKEQKRENQSKPINSRLQIPEAWKGLDDRIEKGPTTISSKPGSSLSQHPAKPTNTTSNSSEVPTRNTVSAASRLDSNKERKGFFGLFAKKAKEDKCKGPIEIGSSISTSSISSGFDLAEEAPGISPRAPEAQLNWLSRFLHIKPATRVLCFHVGRGKARQDIVRMLRDWQRFGVRDVVLDRKTNMINARIDKDNHLKIKPVSFVIELFVVLEHGRRANLCIARFTQTKGAASSFRRVVDIIEDVCSSKNMLVADQEKRAAMCEIFA